MEDIIEPLGEGTYFSAMDQSARMGPSLGDDPPKSPPLVQCLLILPVSAIKQLKMEDGGVHTSYEVLCAHMWKHVSQAKQRPSHEPTYFFVAANCRSRLKPPLPSAYFGNVIGLDVAISTIGKICSESLHATACRVHEAVVAIMQDSLVGFMNWIELPENDLVQVVNSQICRGTGMNVASSPRFPVYDIDFSWGKPVAVRPSKVARNGEIVFFGGNPNLDTGDVELCVCLPHDALKRLLDDPNLLGKSPYNPCASLIPEP